MTLAPIGRVTLPTAYIDLLEVAKKITPDHGYPYPSELVRLTVLSLPRENFAATPEFKHINSFVRGGPSARMLDHMRQRSRSKDPLMFADWIRRMSELYFPVLRVLEMHLDASPSLKHRDNMFHRMEELAENIVESIVHPVQFGSNKKPPKMTPNEELTIALATAHLCLVPGVFNHSPLLTPEFMNCSWKRVVKDDVVDLLLNKHPHKVVYEVLSSYRLTGVADLKHRLDFDIPSFSTGYL